MAKKKNNNKLVNLILMLISVTMAAVSLAGLVCNFISQKSTIIGYNKTTEWGLSRWFEQINDMQDVDGIKNWQIARVFLIATAVLLAIMVVLLLVKAFVKHKVLQWTILGFGIAVVACAVVFMITTFFGCGVLSGGIDAISTGVEYFANVGVYLFSIGAILSAVFAEAYALRK